MLVINLKIATGQILLYLLGNLTLNILIILAVSKYDQTCGDYLSVHASISNGFFACKNNFEGELLLRRKSLTILTIKNIYF